MSWPELTELPDNEIGLLLKDPVAAFLDDTAFRAVGNCLGRIDAMTTKGPPAAPGQHRYGELVSGQLSGLFRHLRNVAIIVQAGAKVSRLTHLHDIGLHLVFGNAVRIVGKVPEKMTKVL